MSLRIRLAAAGLHLARHRRALLAAATCSAAFSPALAAPPPPAETVVITATRIAQPISHVLSDVKVIDEATIRAAGPASLPELLQRHAGVEIAANGGPGQTSAVFVRGTNANHVVLLIDGVRVNSATSGTNAFENLPLDAIERIEVLRGPGSSLYGADAIGGVIQVFTRRGERSDAEVGFGSWRTRTASAGLGRQFGATRFSAQLGYRESDSFSATNEGASFSYNPDRDPYRNVHAELSLQHEWAAGQSLVASVMRSDGKTHFDSSPTTDDLTHQRLTTLALESRNRYAKNWTGSVRIARGRDASSFEGAYADRYATEQDQIGWLNDVTLPVGQLATGLEWRGERVSGQTAFTRTSRDIGAAYASYALESGIHSLQASLRHDDDDQFGGNTTGNLAYGITLAEFWRLSAGAGTAFKAPTFNDLYHPGFFGFYVGNPNLQPERARNLELAARYSRAALRGGLVLFQNRIEDLIAYTPDSTTLTNVNRARIRGATLDGQWQQDDWLLRAEWTHQQPIDEATDLLLARRARNHATASLTYTAGRWQAGAEVVSSSERYDRASNDPATRMAGYTLYNLHATMEFAPRWSARLRIDNATDKRYELAQGYNTAGLGASLILNYSAD